MVAIPASLSLLFYPRILIYLGEFGVWGMKKPYGKGPISRKEKLKRLGEVFFILVPKMVFLCSFHDLVLELNTHHTHINLISISFKLDHLWDLVAALFCSLCSGSLVTCRWTHCPGNGCGVWPVPRSRGGEGIAYCLGARHHSATRL